MGSRTDEESDDDMARHGTARHLHCLTNDGETRAVTDFLQG